jgi:outer membrane protein assembly factor BamB
MSNICTIRERACGSARLGKFVTVALLATSATVAHAQWPQWGGTNRDFAADAKDLAASWPESGPPRLWTRQLGPGYSSIIAADDRLYTIYRSGDDEVVVALDAKTGETLWETKYAAPLPEGMDAQFGKGPNASPLLHGGRLYTLGVAGKLQALNPKSGTKMWSHDLIQEFGAKTPEFGFSSSPVVYRDSLIVAAGGPGVGVMSFDLATGAVQWKKHDFANLYSSPIVIQVDGEDEVVLLTGTHAVGLDPATGDIDWQVPFETQYKTNILTPLWGKDSILFISSAPEIGSRGLRLSKKDGRITAEQAWESRKMQVGQGTAVRAGDHIYASTGDDIFFMMAVDAKSGNVAWRERGMGKSNLLHADGKLIILDEDGNLALAKASPEKFEVQSKVSLLKKPAWTPPTLSGQKLFIRDTETIMALDLGAARNRS